MLGELHDHFRGLTAGWHMPGIARPWFRGHERADWQLVPSILRRGHEQHEFHLTKRFRLLAPGFGVQIDTDRLDQCLFLMQHHRAPTRLLDWSESLNTALFFACLEDLALAGTTASTIFPDLEGLASELAYEFRIAPSEG